MRYAAEVTSIELGPERGSGSGVLALLLDCPAVQLVQACFV